MLFIFVLFSLSSPNLNLNGDVYDISNSNYTSSTDFSTIFSDINKNVEYFDVYSPPITSKYGEVYWTMMNSVLLPDNIVNRFNNKIIAIVGYETDQVFQDPLGLHDISVPITWTYNHHYEAYLRNSNTQIISSNKSDDYGQYNHGAKQNWKIILNKSIDRIQTTYPNNLFFSEANGGEFRSSFHGYPSNYAQLLYSPRFFDIQPMQIDTRNRDPKYINNSIFHAGLLPKNSAAPKNADYSGLLECPCTTRKNISIIHNYNTIISGLCHQNIDNLTMCKQQVLNFGGIVNSNTHIDTINDSNYPSGCSFVQMSNGFIQNITLNNVNSNSNSNLHSNLHSSCGDGSKLFMGWNYTQSNNYSVHINVSLDLTKSMDEQAIITLEGPSDLWYGVAFNAYKMADLPYAIIVNGSGGVFEDKLGNHGPGSVLPNSIKIVSNSVNNNKRRVVLTRALKGNYYSFDTTSSEIPLLTAIGFNGKFSYHHYKASTILSLKAINSSTCICDGGITGTIDGIGFNKNCLPEPRGDLLQQHNPSCFVQTYQGGLSCCSHQSVLLDIDQEQPTHEMTYHLKFRFWFQEYTTQQSLYRFYYQTEAFSGEYDIPQCDAEIPPEECIHSITARFTGRDLIDSKLINNSRGFQLIYVAPHCHAPTCISMELYNYDTGDIICHVDGLLGGGNSSQKYDEKGYIKLNPCLWGYDDGLLKPSLLSWDINLLSIKKNNNTYAHYGDMASWQMRGVIVN